MAPRFDPYAVLGVSRDATADQIAQARRRLSRQYHPDVNGAPDAAARFDEVQRAFHLLSDPAARAEHDRPGGHAGAAPGIVAHPATVNFGRLGPGRPAADATVSVNWTGPRPRRIAGDPGGAWWATVGTASSVSSSVVVFHLRAEAPAGMPDGRRQDQFTVTLDGTTVTVPLTAEFSNAVPPLAPETFKLNRAELWRRLLTLVVIFAVVIVIRVLIYYLARI
jgi:DnaJ domain